MKRTLFTSAFIITNYNIILCIASRYIIYCVEQTRDGNAEKQDIHINHAMCVLNGLVELLNNIIVMSAYNTSSS